MSSFTKPVIELEDDGTSIKLMEPMIYDVGFEGSDKQIIIPRGFICDGASIPRWAWTIIGSPLTGVYRNAAILHDWLYATEYFQWDGITYCLVQNGDLNRQLCDELFYEAMTVLRVGCLKKWLIYRAVRNFGGFVWDKHTIISVNEERALY